MKVLVSGGQKTDKVVEAIEKKLNSGVEFIVVPFIEDIPEIFYRGEYYDKAIIIEHSCTHEGTDTNENSLRSKINDFSRLVKDKGIKAQHIFLTRYIELADMIYEESITIRNNTAVVLKAPKYSVSFFIELITTDINNLGSDLVYHPTIQEPEIPVEDEPEKDIDYEIKTGNPADIFGGFETTSFENGDNNIGFDMGLGDNAGLTGNEFGDNFGGSGGSSEGFGESDEYEEIREEGEENVQDNLGGTDGFEYTDDSNGMGYNYEEYKYDDEPGYSDGLEGESASDVDAAGFGAYDTPEETKTKKDDTGFKDEDYEAPKTSRFGRKNKAQAPNNMSNKQVRSAIQAFANRGNSIVVTGCGGCGTSTIAYHLANTISNIGYSVLLVDFDIKGRTQSYISKDNYESMEPDGANLRESINSNRGINSSIAIISPNFHLLSMGIGGDIVPIDQMFRKDRILRFLNMAKTSHQFIIYDIPFDYATGPLSDIVYMCDNLVMVIDASTWGVTKAMIGMCNIETEEMQDSMFSRAQIVFNRCRGVNKIYNNKVKTAVDFTAAMDNMVQELIGEDPGFYFSDLKIAGAIDEDKAFELGWFGKNQFSNTKQGQEVFNNLLQNILLN